MVFCDWEGNHVLAAYHLVYGNDYHLSVVIITARKCGTVMHLVRSVCVRVYIVC